MLLAEPADGAAHHDHAGSLSARCGHLTELNVTALTAPALDGGDQVAAAAWAAAGKASTRVGEGDDGHAGVLDPVQLGGGRGAVRQQPARGGGGDGDDHRVGVEVLRVRGPGRR